MKRLTILICFITSVVLTTANAQSSKKPVSEYLYQVIESDGIDAAVEKYENLKEMKSSNYDLSQQQLNGLGYRLLNENKHQQAVAIFKLNADTYPESINVWDSLGEGYLVSGERERATELYRKVLEMLKSDTTLPPPVKNFFKNNAQTKIFVAEHFDAPIKSDLHYVSYYGGVPAGKWDMQNILEFKKREDIKLSYDGNNFYQSPVPTNVEQRLTDANLPDVATGSIAGDYRRFIERGLLADISDLWQREGWDEVFPESFKEMGSYEGKQYFVPMAYQWNPIWYRKDIFDKHDLTPPESWDELLELCDRLNELGYTPFTISVQNWPPPMARWFTILNLRLNGPDFHEQVMRGNIPYTDDRIRNVFVHWRELFRNEAFADSSFTNNYQAGIKAFTSGDAVMYNLGEWIFESPQVQKIEEKLDFFAFPKMSPDVKDAEIVHAYGAYMLKDSNPKPSETLLKWLASTESQESNAKINNRIVANRNVDQSLYSDVQKRISRYINGTEVLVPLLEVNTHPEFATKALSIFQEYWEHPEDIDVAMNKLEEARKEVFDLRDSP